MMNNNENKNIKDMSNVNKIEGKNAFIEAFNAKINFKKVLVQKGFRDEKINKILNILKEKKVVIDFIDKENFDKMSDIKVNHGIIYEKRQEHKTDWCRGRRKKTVQTAKEYKTFIEESLEELQ